MDTVVMDTDDGMDTEVMDTGDGMVTEMEKLRKWVGYADDIGMYIKRTKGGAIDILVEWI